MSPRVAQGHLHGKETDYYSFACLLLTTTEPDFERVLSRIYAREYPGEGKGKGKSGKLQEILKNKSPEDYLDTMLEQGKSDPETRETTLSLEEKLNSHPNFKRAVVDSFIVSSGIDPDAAAARAWSTIPISTGPPENKFYGLPAGRRSMDIKDRTNEVDSETARNILTELSTRVKGKEGVLKLMHTTDPNRKMTFERKSWYQFFLRRDSNMKDTAVYLQGLFRQALEGCDEIDKALLLDDLGTYLKGRNNQFGTKSLVAFVERLEALKSSPGIVKQRQPTERTYGKELLTEAETRPWESDSMERISTLGTGARGTAYWVKAPISESHSTAHVDRVVKVKKEKSLHPIRKGLGDDQEATQT